ncbi:DNA-3-methyladenine glycosylase [Pseudoclavibacter sp. RFBI5]|uniref:DNA-3-methyladenine glycosylase 2 family protein n=1 Tax=Pseudoclavibacter sp. RFBI5 TaxID=2080578 RepID=UPI000CE8F09D|nr:DNA-3-methyladenine glycosylase 2 [Pseudoclavibacter sp. RFBI5]PPG04992.1 DNA-3-methyladenine glycosylase [Pseudoclavibacter sp. RFBI5]
MASITLTGDERYRAILAKDRRFDGQFITAVGSTGIYCRPSCPARTPKRENVTFYPTSAAAHEAGYRACKRCLPDAAPGDPAWNLRGDVAGRAMRLIGDGVVEREGVPGLAARLGYSSRHLARVLTAELGAGPLALARAQRARTAATLLGATDLPFGEVAFAAGFASVRAFNETIQEVFQLTPTLVRERSRRRAVAAASRVTDGGLGSFGAGLALSTGAAPLTLSLAYREPYDAVGVFAWLRERAIDGVEVATDDRYERSLLLPGGPAWFGVDAGGPQPASLRLRARLTDLSDLQALVTRVRRLFDLDADPAAVDGALSVHPAIAERVRLRPGRRLPGAVDPDEMLFRAIIGQQITVSAARTALGRLAARAGASLGQNGDNEEHAGELGVNRLFPSAAAIAELGEASFAGPRARSATITRVAEAIADGRLRLSPGDDIAEQHEALTAFKGIGDWTAGYVSMRVLGNPDVLLTGDVALRSGARALGLPPEPRALTDVAEQFRPWRSYLSLHLWGAVPPRARPGTKIRATAQTPPTTTTETPA